MSLMYIFSSFLYSEILTDIDNEQLVEYSHKCREGNTGVVKSNYGGWQSDTLTIPNDQIGKLVDAIVARVDSLRPELGIKKESRIYLNNLWININPPGSFNRPHVHPECIFAGVYYVAVPPGSGSISFKHPATAQQYHTPDDLIDEFNAYSAASWAVDPEPGKLVIFPGWLEHYVEPNLSNGERISIAFNVNLEKE